MPVPDFHVILILSGLLWGVTLPGIIALLPESGRGRREKSTAGQAGWSPKDAECACQAAVGPASRLTSQETGRPSEVLWL